MFEASAAPRETVAASAAIPERADYGAREGRKAFFAIALLVVLPFALSLPIMLYHRLAYGLWFDVAQLAVLATALAAILAMLFLELLFSLRARLTLGKTALSFTLPAGLGPTPLLRYQSRDIPYHTIKGVELRREIFGAPLMPVVMQGAVVHTKDKGSITLGYSKEVGGDPPFPFAEIAQKVARRAAVPLVEQRTIWKRPRSDRALEYISEIDTETYIVDPAEVARLNAKHRRLVLAVGSAAATLVLLGIGADIMTGG